MNWQRGMLCFIAALIAFCMAPSIIKWLTERRDLIGDLRLENAALRLKITGLEKALHAHQVNAELRGQKRMRRNNDGFIPHYLREKVTFLYLRKQAGANYDQTTDKEPE